MSCKIDVSKGRTDPTNRWFKYTFGAKSESKPVGFLNRSLFPFRLGARVPRIPVDLIVEIPAGSFLFASTSSAEARGQLCLGPLRVHLALCGGHRRNGRGLRVGWFRIASVEIRAMPERGVRVWTDERTEMNTVAYAR